MRVVEGRLILGATDLSDYIVCEHLTQLEIRRAHGEELPRSKTALAELLATLGGEHETRWVDARREAGERVREFDPEATRRATTLAELEHAAAETAAEMRTGTELLYQPFFFDGTWQARADFLVRVDRPSALGDYSYEVYDAKLVRHVRVEALLQLCEYSLQVSHILGVMPDQMHVVLGDGVTRSFAVLDFAAYHRVIRAQFEEALRGSTAYPEKVAHCRVCDYAEFCDARRRTDSHLSLVARMRRDQVRKLNASGVQRMDDLAQLKPATNVSGMAPATLDALREQARLQVAGAGRGVDAPPLWELLAETEPGFGLEALPEPSAHDVFFDMEGDAFMNDEPIEYLFGIVETVNGAPAYREWSGHTPAEERRAFEGFIDWLIERLEVHPDMHVFHYGDYERSALQRLMGRHGTREAEVDRLLRGGVLVDLYRVVRQSLRLSTESYGLKQVERLYMPHRSGEVADGESSLVMYARWVRDRDPAVLQSIVRYNEVDCRSTLLLRDWLEARRVDLERTSGLALGRPAARDGAAPAPVAEQQDATEAVRAQLLRRVPDEAALRSAPEQATWLLAQLLGYHRREQKVEWWRWFGHIAMTEEELGEDREALGPLTYAGTVDTIKQSTVERYRFDPQEHAIREGTRPSMPCIRDGSRDAAPAGKVVRIDNAGGTIDLLRGSGVSERGHPRFLIPPTPIGAKAQAASLLALGELVASGLDPACERRAALDLLLRVPSRGAGGGTLRAAGESAEDAAVRVASALDGGYLAVQGPPGAGKTYTAARIALRLASEGKRVAVTATAHKVIAGLLEEIATAATTAAQPLRIVQKCDEDEFCAAAGATRAPRNDDVVAALESGAVDVVGGTAWVFADETVAGRFDTLIVDEAAQMSLADVIACSRCARNLVLVGDPRQLSHVVQGSHPAGVGVSALSHLLQDRPTVAADSGIFLDRTWRMAPEICGFVSDAFYQGRLEAVEECARQWVDGTDAPALRGLFSVPVAHEGDRTHSQAEAARVRNIFDELVGRRWRHRDGSERTLGLRDILVVAPYNAHVAALTAALPAGSRVGTVDRFQGQEAAVSIFSLATSSAEELPRNLEFLYSTHRLNVAVSRARCLSLLVYSPALLRTRCHTPEQMRLVNALCRYVEAAARWPHDTADPEAPRQLSLLTV